MTRSDMTRSVMWSLVQLSKNRQVQQQVRRPAVFGEAVSIVAAYRICVGGAERDFEDRKGGDAPEDRIQGVTSRWLDQSSAT